MNRFIPLLALTLILAACGAPAATQPATLVPIVTSTPVPAPTRTSTLIPSATPTPGLVYPSSISPADVDFLKAHADDPNVHWTVDADGVTTVEMRQPLNLTEAEEIAAIKAECLGNCFLKDESIGDFVLFGVYTGEIDVVFQPNGSTEVVTSMNILVNDEIRTVSMRWFLDPKDSTNEWLYRRLGIQGDQATLVEIARVFAAGKSASPGFFLREPDTRFKNTAFYQRYFEGRYGPDHWAAVQAWIDSGFDPALAIELPVSGY